MKHSQSVSKLSKFLAYVLGKQPDEFGLVPDENGYMKTKNLLKVMSEEEGWRHVRLGHIREILYTAPSPVIEMEGNKIRAVDRSSLFSPQIPIKIPKLLYHPIRQRAYPFVHEKGLITGDSEDHIILTDNTEFAARLGRRIDEDPVLLTINTAQTLQKGADIKQFGKLFLSNFIPHGCFNGPPLLKDRHVPKKPGSTKIPEKPKTPGSYFLDLNAEPPTTDRKWQKKGKLKNVWKRERKRRNSLIR